MLAVAYARYLTVALPDDHLVYAEDQPGGNMFLARMPSTPDIAVGLFPSGGFHQPTLDASDLPTLQVRVRGPEQKARPPYELARRIYDVSTCLDLVTLDDGGPDEVRVISCTALQSDPVPLGQDVNERFEFVLNLAFDVHAPTLHRPSIPA